MARKQKPAVVPEGTNDILVVGIGASAGGLEALQEFFKAVPLDTGLAFVVIQHLSPDYKSLMDELLARHTKMPIRVAADTMPVEPNTIYLIPPRKDLSLFRGRLVLQEQSLKKGIHLPVDIFFGSLAAEKGKSAIGIILSGTGSDGTLGTRAIKEAGGMVMAQDERSSKFDGMPRSAIATGLVDFILTPTQMPETLVSYVHHPFVQRSRAFEDVLSRNASPLNKVAQLLKEHSGIDFSLYREATVIRRLERRVSINRFDTVEDYLVYLRDSDKEKETLFREMLIGVTRFFRDPEAFEVLAAKVFPLLAVKKQIRLWSAGCSTGEEVYSLAILLLSYLEKNRIVCEVKIFATDVDRHALDTAGRGFYPDSVVADVEPALLTRYFVKRENGYQVSEAVRKLVVFASHNLLKDPPFSRLDLLVCRNLFIYFKPEVQGRILGVFHHSLSPEGFLFLGSSESLGTVGEGFETVDNKNKIYRQRPAYQVPLDVAMPPTAPVYPDPESRGRVLRRQEVPQWEKVTAQALSLFLPPSVIVDNNDQIVQTINDTSRFLRIQPGRFSSLLFEHLSPELGLMVSSLLRKLRKGTNDFQLDNLVGLPGLEKETLTLEGHQISTDRATYSLVSFRITAPAAAVSTEAAEPQEVHQLYQGRVADLERELQFTRESLQATVEELETSNEELQSSNEELIASNEELQSTNEELQSVNEELYTVNAEFQNKISELTHLINDETNLLRNTDIGALYLDTALSIRKLTPKVSTITRIMPSDINRPLVHLSVLPSWPQLLDDVHWVLDTLGTRDREIRGLDEQDYLTSIRPYRTAFNAVDGILITFVNITKLKEQRDLTDAAQGRLDEALQRGRMAWWEWDVVTGEVHFDPRKATMLGYTVEEFPATVEGICAYIHPEDYEPTMQAMRDHLAGRTPLWDVAYRIRQKDGGWATYYDRGTVTERTPRGAPLKMVGSVLLGTGGLP